MSKLDSGAIAITLDGRAVKLQPSIAAARLISAKYGGLQPIVPRLNALEMTAFVDVIRHGLALKDAEAKGLDEKIWKTGLVPLLTPCVEYVAVLMNGGRPVRDKEEKGAGPDASSGEEKAEG